MNELAIRPIFMIVPTLRCDHTCKYCQVSRASVNASGYDLIDLILISFRLSTIDTTLQDRDTGWKPLLRFDLIQSIYEQCTETLGSSDFEMVIASSLSVLNEDMLHGREAGT
jgi:hypothetical protein